MRAPITGLALLVAVPLPLAGPATAETAPVDLAPLHSAEVTFGIYALGAKAMDVAVAVGRRQQQLQIDTAVKTTGPLDFVMRFELTGKLAAELQDGQLQPVRYMTASDGRWSKRSIRIQWGPDGLPVAEVEPEPSAEDREPVPDELKYNTIDPTTAAIARALRPGVQPPCSGVDPIFDGRRRYNLHYRPVGSETLKPHNRSAYAGPAFRCALTVEPVAGYTKEWLEKNRETAREPTHVWMAQPPGRDVWIPVQIESSFAVGSSTGWISSARLDGRTWLKPLGPIRAEIPPPVTP